ncbi:hypothetical protein [Phyllobacterium myrsinacearum]|uniref:hypothetical protein n=1 Tax=Phyllobacterium myrsinacearum TaxID=28101 RepID=UPI0013EE5C88|nr:hypothetical protein [Phyllobacterium myrsinacearum]
MSLLRLRPKQRISFSVLIGPTGGHSNPGQLSVQINNAAHDRHEVAFNVLNTPVLSRNLSAFEQKSDLRGSKLRIRYVGLAAHL